MSFQLVKLHATASTNEELKVRFRESELPNLTTIYTDHQTAGKGQMGSSWVSEPFKNLTFSVLLSNLNAEFTDFEINKLVTVVLVEWLREKLQIQAVIKWPNDILSVRHKLAGVLIENIYKGNSRACSIIGIGLNVNQMDFPDLEKAISLNQITNKTYDLELLLIDFLQALQKALANPGEAISRYEQHLFKYHQEARFQIDGKELTARVEGVDDTGRLILISNTYGRSTYGLKQVKWVY
ncbi:biotin--[acetyl-CoA-carboxylase] ligase [Nonlabens marinus]|uniref:Biotin-protein ligase n=1 Tax=Nonlabens marinus S1-08 TaxID=1454201 RepID=W8VN67_9FLAO|nr:biotin--[acetyl-CoA-carboxylase] ligase [Nonlabens marinus]BAO54269.1 biotin-protein ligase [Nonlabens marinus S1-08]